MRDYLSCQLLAFILVQSANAMVVLDQEFMLTPHTSINYYHDYPGDYLSQTFTVQNTGKLAGVGVQASVSGRGQFVDDLHIRVTRVGSDGFPLIDEVLAEATIEPSELPVAPTLSPPTITDVDLSNWHLRVSIGDRLAILLSSDHAYYSPEQGPHYVWFFELGNPHPGGEFSIYSPQLYGPTPLRDIWLPAVDKTVDAGFRVYVDAIPEPNSLLLIACVLVGCSCSIANRCRGRCRWFMTLDRSDRT